MYYDYGICWKEEAKKRRIFIFGAGKKGKWLADRLRVNGINNIVGIIDNNEEVVEMFNGGKSWIDCGYSPARYREISNTENDLIIISTDFYNIKKQLMGLGIFNFISYDEIDLSAPGETHYDNEYFKMQIEYAKVDSELDFEFFSRFIWKEATIAEFGSGGGLLLNKLECASKVGIEINKFAKEHANGLGINTVERISEINNESLDVVISTHALEHCLRPFEIVCELKTKIKKNGIAVFVVPYEPLEYGYMLNDISQHIYTWTERTLGNLFRNAGFYIRETGTKEAAWPNNWESLFKKTNNEIFTALSVLESYRTGYRSVYVVAENV